MFAVNCTGKFLLSFVSRAASQTIFSISVIARVGICICDSDDVGCKTLDGETVFEWCTVILPDISGLITKE